MSSHTIFALATPPAKSGVAVIRISGPGAPHAVVRLTGLKDWQPNLARHAALKRPDGNVIDHGLVLCFRAPKSFTGEDVAELQVHGSLAVIRELLDMLGTMEGLRPADPGEFTRRAFLNGKMDLLEAEGLADLIDAETPAQVAQARRQIHGESSRHYEKLRARLVKSLALLEAYIDFPDEEIPDSALADVNKNIVALKEEIAGALADNRSGERLREGFRIVILGAPNVGKSSLLNALSGRDAAIVSHHAGTTRDVIEVHMNIGGFPVILTDTAGLRDAADDIEEEGVRRALRKAQEADFKLVLFDAAEPPDAAALRQVDNNTLIIINKIDICPTPVIKLPFKNNILHISAATGQGVEELLKNIENTISSLFSAPSALITRQRHRAALQGALRHLENFSPQKPIELACEELRLAGGAIGGITGKIAPDELLDVIFKEFCIGK